MLGDPVVAAIVEGIIGLTVAFRRSVIAEGVETMGHGAMLLSLGCFQAQGYGVARPMPAQEVAPWIHAWASGERWKALQTLPTIAQAH